MCHSPHRKDYIVILVVTFSMLVPSNCTNADGNVSTTGDARLPDVNVAALFAFNSTIGRVAKPALELAVKDVNSNETLLNGRKLLLTMVDSNCNVFVGTAEGMMQVEMAEGRTCKTPSGKFNGYCVNSANCKNVCATKGFPSGSCDFHVAGRKCYCSKPCP